ncbi:hypothetical protein FXW78_51175 [Rhodococcus opacus]|nr:hypothetical protein [Rhodococcus opacus]
MVKHGGPARVDGDRRGAVAGMAPSMRDGRALDIGIAERSRPAIRPLRALHARKTLLWALRHRRTGDRPRRGAAGR